MKNDKTDKSAARREEYEFPGEWLTAPASGDDGELVMVTGRTDVTRFRDNPRFNIRVTVSWRYGESGMPDTATSQLMQDVAERLVREFTADPVAVLTGIYTGGGLREWVFYTLSLNIFGRKLHEQLADLPLLPLEISAESDPGWEEYTEMTEVIREIEN